MIKNKVTKNAFWIIGCRIVQAILALIINMLTARYLGPSNFGIISYAASIVAFVVPIMNLGISNVLVNEIIKRPEKEGETLGTSMVLTFISSLFCIIGVGAFVLVANPGEVDTLIVCVLYSLLLIAQSMEIVQYWFQAKLMSKYTSLTMLFAYTVVSVYKTILLITGKGVYWFAISNAFDYCIIAIILLVIYHRKGGQKLKISLSTAKVILGQSRYYIVSGLMVTIFAQTDKIMLKLMNGNSEVGYYSAAVTIASMTSFVFSAIIDSMRPLIFEKKKEDAAAFQKNVSRLYGIIIYLALAQSAVITLFAPLCVKILYGADFSPAVSALRIIVWYTTFSYLGSVRNVWILAEGKQKYLWIINSTGALGNVILNFCLIGSLGIDGAAIASLVTQIFTNVILGFIIKPILPNNILMLKGLNIKNILSKPE